MSYFIHGVLTCKACPEVYPVSVLVEKWSESLSEFIGRKSETNYCEQSPCDKVATTNGGGGVGDLLFSTAILDLVFRRICQIK